MLALTLGLLGGGAQLLTRSRRTPVQGAAHEAASQRPTAIS
jgi:hypothetical protein